MIMGPQIEIPMVLFWGLVGLAMFVAVYPLTQASVETKLKRLRKRLSELEPTPSSRDR